ncbi:MAG: DEAD/DEAH box helicase, partial [Gillisia sp.]
MTFQDLNLNTPLLNALEDLKFQTPTPIQEQAFSSIMSGKDVVGIAQTGTGKTFAYMLPILRMLKYSEQKNPRVLVMVPTRELAVQVAEEIEKLTKYINTRVVAIYGGVNINTQHQDLLQGTDIVVATPGRLYDLVLRRALQLKSIQKLVIDEVDVMLDLGFRFQIINILELLPDNRQSIMFSATMTEAVEELIDLNFKAPEKISVAISGTPLENIEQRGYLIPNFHTKVNFLRKLLKD